MLASRKQLFQLIGVVFFVALVLAQPLGRQGSVFATTPTMSPSPGGPSPTTLPQGGPAYLVKDIAPGGDSSGVVLGVDVGGPFYFSADSAPATGAWALWKTDGTVGGTVRIKGFTSQPHSFVNLNGRLYFEGNDGVSGPELWTSDGTTAGTVLVADTAPGSYGNVYNLVAAGGRLFFLAMDDVNGEELWTSDGTASGTRLVRDIKPGAASGAPRNLTPSGNTLFFT